MHVHTYIYTHTVYNIPVCGERLKSLVISKQAIQCFPGTHPSMMFGSIQKPFRPFQRSNATHGENPAISSPRKKLIFLTGYPIGSMYGIYANIWGILMVNVTIYSMHGSYGHDLVWNWIYQMATSTHVDKAIYKRSTQWMCIPLNPFETYSSMGKIIPYIMENKTCLTTPTRYILNLFPTNTPWTYIQSGIIP